MEDLLKWSNFENVWLIQARHFLENARNYQKWGETQ